MFDGFSTFYESEREAAFRLAGRRDMMFTWKIFDGASAGRRLSPSHDSAAAISPSGASAEQCTLAAATYDSIHQPIGHMAWAMGIPQEGWGAPERCAIPRAGMPFRYARAPSARLLRRGRGDIYLMTRHRLPQRCSRAGRGQFRPTRPKPREHGRRYATARAWSSKCRHRDAGLLFRAKNIICSIRAGAAPMVPRN